MEKKNDVPAKAGVDKYDIGDGKCTYTVARKDRPNEYIYFEDINELDQFAESLSEYTRKNKSDQNG